MSKAKMINCRFCVNKIDRNVKVCPSCGATNSKPIYKRWWFIAFMSLLLLATLAGY